MARVVKEADVRRKELLDTASRLFETAGYENTSIAQIVEAVDVAKGTFYHYFDSKQDLLEQLVRDWADALYEQLEAEMVGVEGDAVTRLRGLFQRSGNLKVAKRDEALTFARSLYSPDNLRLRHALMAEWLPRTEALMAPIIADGIVEGTFRVADAAATATVLGSLWFGWGDRQAELLLHLGEDVETLGRILADVTAVEAGMERILGISEGSLGLDLAGQLRRFMEA